MLPKIELKNGKESYTRHEVEEMLSEINDAFVNMFKAEVVQFKFAKAISYLSLITCILVLICEVLS